MARQKQEEHTTEASAHHPKYTEQLIGYKAVEQQLLDLVNADRLPHALLITGRKGIGKATLAYHLARYLLTKHEQQGGGLFGDAPAPTSLSMSAKDPMFARVAAGSHPDLLVLEADSIKVEDARKVPEFLSLTPAMGERRVVIIDAAEALNRNAANALLKAIEEPPNRATILMVCHNPGLVLPTIKSRCRKLAIAPLSKEDFNRVLLSKMPEASVSAQLFAELSGNSPGIALSLMEGKAEAVYKELLEQLVRHETTKLYSFAERFARKDHDKEWQVLKHLCLWVFHRIATLKLADGAELFLGEKDRLAQLAAGVPPEVWLDKWEQSRKLFADTEHLYLDRKQVILTLLRAA